MIDIEEKRALVERALQMVRDAGIRDARIAWEGSVENSVIVRNGRTDRLSGASGSTLFIQLFHDGHYGSFSTNMTQEAPLRDFIKGCAAGLEISAREKERHLPEASRCYRGPLIDLKQADSAIGDITPEKRLEYALAACSEMEGDERLISAEAEWGDTLEASYMADTQGFAGHSLKTLFTLGANCSIRGNGDEKPEAWWHDSDTGLSRLEMSGIGKTALERALFTLGARKTASGTLPAVIENTCAAKMVAPLISALSGPQLHQEASFLKQHIGKRIFPEWLTLTDDPHMEGHYGARLFDDEGVATSKRRIIDEGVVAGCFISTYYGEKLGMEPTVDSPTILTFEKNCKNREKPLSLHPILKELDEGMFINGFNGGNYNPATGDFSYGVRGARFKGRELLHPVSEMNITGNFIDLWRNVVAVGDDPRKCGRWKIPTLAFSGISFSGF